MSDSEAFSDELLELAGATEKKRKRRQGNAKASGSKRRKADDDIESEQDDGPESEEEDEDANPYPLENKFVDEADRARLMTMPEIEREEVLAQRLEEMQRIQDKRNLDQMFKATQGGAGDDESVSKAAKRQHPVRGATKEKSRKLDELKARRKAKDVKKKSRSSPKRERSSSPMDMETSDEDEEDGQVTKIDLEEERERRILEKANPQVERITLVNLEAIRLSRDSLAKHCLAPWFEDYVKGAWVRYLIGDENGQPIYRICEIADLSADLVKPYKINNQLTDQNVDLRHGTAVKAFPMDKVSNSPFTAREFERLVKVYETENVKLPNKREIEKKQAKIQKFASTPMTESDISAMLARKAQIQASANPAAKSASARLLEKTKLQQQRNLAMRRNDRVEVAALDKQLEELALTMGPQSDNKSRDESADIMVKVNERNRKANQESMRMAALAEAERKRRERQAAAKGAATAASSADPSARLKTVPRTFTSSRPSTPATKGASQPATPGSVSPLPAGASPAAPLPKTMAKDDFASKVLESIEIDLGDF